MSIVVVQRPALATGGVAGGGGAVNSYLNDGGRGDRQSIITETTNLTGMPTAEFADMFDGVEIWDSSTYAADFTGGEAVSGKWMKMQFSEGKNISEIMWVQSTSATHGVWKLQGSNNDVDWTDQGSSFTLGGTLGESLHAIADDGNFYTYFRLLGVSGNAVSTPWCNAINFKIKAATAESGPPSYDNYPGQGDWNTWATLTSTATFVNGTLDELFDNVFSTGVGTMWFTNVQTLREIKMATPEALVVNEFEWQQTNTGTHGTWIFEGSNNDTDWDTLTAAFTLGGATTQVVTATVFAAGHTYFRLRQTAGATASSPDLLGIRFKSVRADNYTP